MDKRELWDEFSQHIDSDIDSLQMFADRSVVTETDFYKALEKQEEEFKKVVRYALERAQDTVKQIEKHGGYTGTLEYLKQIDIPYYESKL